MSFCKILWGCSLVPASKLGPQIPPTFLSQLEVRMTSINFYVNNLFGRRYVHAISHMKNKRLYFAKMYLNTKWAWNKFTSTPTIKIKKKEMLKKRIVLCFWNWNITTTLFSHNLDDLSKITETCGLGSFCLISMWVIMGLNDLQKWTFSHCLQTELYDHSGIFLTSVFFF